MSNIDENVVKAIVAIQIKNSVMVICSTALLIVLEGGEKWWAILPLLFLTLVTTDDKE